MSILGLTADELTLLRGFVHAAIERPCIPDWEFESLIGCSRADALRRVESDLQHAGHDEQLLDQLVGLLSLLAGAAQIGANPMGREPVSAQLEQLIEKLSSPTEEHHHVRQSSVSLRASAQLPGPRATVQKYR